MTSKLRPGFGPKTEAPKSPSATATSQPPSPVAVAEGPRPKPLQPGSVTAKVLARVWRGGEATVVDSGPGAGKTTLLATVISNLATRAEMNILVATPTRAQALSLAHRLALELPISKIKVDMNEVEPGELPRGYDPRQFAASPPQVTIATMAKAKSLAKDGFDVVVFDEAYQATHAMAAQARGGIPQVLMVGDPGQIGPVVTVDTSIWEGQKDAPHLPAPLVMSDYTDVERFSLGVTYRLGPVSAAVVAPVYKFKVESGRPQRDAVTRDGELVTEIHPIEVEHSDEIDNLDCLSLMVNRAAEFVGGSLLQGDDARQLIDKDVAIVVSRNSQVSILTGMARSLGYDFAIGTADRLQGGEWPVVVALDAMYGSNGESEHNQSIGRLCVMVSRHTAHLTWIHDDSWIEATQGNGQLNKVNRRVREALVGKLPVHDDFADGF